MYFYLQGTSLQKAIREDDDLIKQLESAVINAKDTFAKQKETREAEIKHLEVFEKFYTKIVWEEKRVRSGSVYLQSLL